MNEALKLTVLIAAAIAAAPMFIIGWRLGWRYVQYSLRRRDNHPLSALQYALKKFQFAAGCGLLFAGATAGVAYLVITAAVSSLAPDDRPATDEIVRQTSTQRDPEPVVRRPAKRERVSEGRKPEPAPKSQPEEPLNAAVSAVPPMRAEETAMPDAAFISCAKMRAEIEQLEKERQYSGDDEIVRARLDLPPKPTCN